MQRFYFYFYNIAKLAMEAEEDKVEEHLKKITRLEEKHLFSVFY